MSSDEEEEGTFFASEADEDPDANKIPKIQLYLSIVSLNAACFLVKLVCALLILIRIRSGYMPLFLNMEFAPALIIYAVHIYASILLEAALDVYGFAKYWMYRKGRYTLDEMEGTAIFHTRHIVHTAFIYPVAILIDQVELFFLFYDFNPSAGLVLCLICNSLLWFMAMMCSTLAKKGAIIDESKAGEWSKKVLAKRKTQPHWKFNLLERTRRGSSKKKRNRNKDKDNGPVHPLHVPLSERIFVLGTISWNLGWQLCLLALWIMLVMAHSQPVDAAAMEPNGPSAAAIYVNSNGQTVDPNTGILQFNSTGNLVGLDHSFVENSLMLSIQLCFFFLVPLVLAVFYIPSGSWMALLASTVYMLGAYLHCQDTFAEAALIGMGLSAGLWLFCLLMGIFVLPWSKLV